MNSSPKNLIFLSFTASPFIFPALKAEILPKIFIFYFIFFHREKKKKIIIQDWNQLGVIKWWQTFIFRWTIALRFVFPESVFSHDIQCWFCSAFYPLPLFPTLLSSGFCLLSVCVGKFFDMAWNKNRFFFLTSHFICSVTLWALPPGLLISGYYIFIHIFLFAMLHTFTTGRNHAVNKQEMFARALCVKFTLQVCAFAYWILQPTECRRCPFLDSRSLL